MLGVIVGAFAESGLVEGENDGDRVVDGDHDGTIDGDPEGDDDGNTDGV